MHEPCHNGGGQFFKILLVDFSTIVLHNCPLDLCHIDRLIATDPILSISV